MSFDRHTLRSCWESKVHMKCFKRSHQCNHLLSSPLRSPSHLFADIFCVPFYRYPSCRTKCKITTTFSLQHSWLFCNNRTDFDCLFHVNHKLSVNHSLIFFAHGINWASWNVPFHFARKNILSIWKHIGTRQCLKYINEHQIHDLNFISILPSHV